MRLEITLTGLGDNSIRTVESLYDEVIRECAKIDASFGGTAFVTVQTKVTNGRIIERQANEN